jgi:DNA modification methylase
MKNLDKMIEIKCDCDKVIDFHELTEFQGGLKERTQADYDKAKKSILKYGWSFVLYYWNDGKTKWIIDGHNRVTVLKQLEKDGYFIPPIPAIEVFCKDRKEAKEKLLRLNSTFGKLTKESVLEFAEDIDLNFDEIALPDTTIDFTDQSGEIAETEGDDEAPEVDEKSEPVSKRGEMYELGNSILMCGDSTNAEDVARLMGGEKADMVFTDPPYGMGLDTDYSSMKNKLEFAEGKNIKNGKKYAQGIVDAFKPELITTVFENFGYCKEIFLWGADYFAEMLEDKNNGSWVVWDKRASAENDLEKDESADKMYGSCFELCWSKNKHKRDIARVKWAGVFGTEQEFDHKRYHPTQKPIKLVEWFLTRYAKKGWLVVDLFGGSGSTLIGCEKNEMRCRTMELDPHYCDVIRKRYTLFAKQNGLKITSGCLE